MSRDAVVCHSIGGQRLLEQGEQRGRSVVIPVRVVDIEGDRVVLCRKLPQPEDKRILCGGLQSVCGTCDPVDTTGFYGERGIAVCNAFFLILGVTAGYGVSGWRLCTVETFRRCFHVPLQKIAGEHRKTKDDGGAQDDK